MTQAWRWGKRKVQSAISWAKRNWRKVASWLNRGLSWGSILQLILQLLGLA
ncbi:aureocin A53 family class IId bacteriocin [Microbacterium amylolyticum]|uniref:Transposase n=1 Tax=Microbacterium amylolyticum TaxID=936337 RepID=A0ABS4ZH48_9MICO|nr:aureocin A53 family class IId bacteriocin [Microbacterium amylolyticum]MBP2436604.1 hypothetical protein [Microbacterium amylolyticum]